MVTDEEYKKAQEVVQAWNQQEKDKRKSDPNYCLVCRKSPCENKGVSVYDDWDDED